MESNYVVNSQINVETVCRRNGNESFHTCGIKKYLISNENIWIKPKKVTAINAYYHSSFCFPSAKNMIILNMIIMIINVL